MTAPEALAGRLMPLWQGRKNFTVLDTDFGLGHHFLCAWSAWRADPQAPGHLFYVAVLGQPPQAAELQRAHAHDPLIRPLADVLQSSWPPLTPNVHVLDFEHGRVRLLLALGDLERVLPNLQLQANTIWISGSAATARAGLQAHRLAAALARKAGLGTELAAEQTSDAFALGLRAAGFVVSSAAAGPDRALQAHYDPHFKARRSPVRSAVPSGSGEAGHALLIGAGLAGSLAAQALARSGWRCTVLDRHRQPAQEASGNPAGLFHGTAHAGDGLHARWTRAAALFAQQRYVALIRSGAVAGEVSGVLRVNPSALSPGLAAPAYLQCLSAAQAVAEAGCEVNGPAWLYPGGGWVSPMDLCKAALRTPGVHWHGDVEVQRLEMRGGLWHALDASNQVLGRGQIVVCATGAAPPPFETGLDLPLQAVRGQVSWLPAEAVDASSEPPKLPLSGHGYALRMPEGRLLFGASSHPGDPEHRLREGDHAFNVGRLAALCGLRPKPGAVLDGRVAWRATMPDRLPLVGAWPVPAEQVAAGTRQDHCRMVPRVAGLYVLMGLASRGLTWGPLAAEVLAAWVNGTPMPLEADLLDAIDPARSRVRQVRRATSSSG